MTCRLKPPEAAKTTAVRRTHPTELPALFTVGHSNHSADRLIELLSAAGVNLVADVRRFPQSRRWPQFNQDQLQAHLNAAGIGYLWLPALGGRRHLRTDAPTYAGWEQPGFRAYAAHMSSPEFQSALTGFIASVGDKRPAVICAEGLWWQCHRRLIADQLLVLGHTVRHIMPDGLLVEHVLTPFAVVRDGRLTYPAPVQRALFGAR